MSNLPSLSPMDRRLNLLTEEGDLLESQGTPAALKVAFTELRPRPDFSAAIDTMLVFGERVTVHDQQNGWAWVQAERDSYVGWLEVDTLAFNPEPATHLVCVPRTFFYPEPDMKTPHKGMRSMGSAVRIVGETENRGTQYALTENGDAVIANHICPLDFHREDYVSVAEELVYTPYLWAGTTAFGIDCSGLVKLSLLMCGKSVLRDSDMQAATIGTEIDAGEKFTNIKRGDLVFWKGHVGICQGIDEAGVQRVIHANGHTMDVSSEPLQQAIDRIAYLYEKPIGFKRP